MSSPDRRATRTAPLFGTAQQPVLHMPGAERQPRRRGTLRWHQLIGVTFFAVCGGDYGIEDTVGAAGARLTLAGLLVLPWIWSLPIALMTAELSAMIPESGGYVVWVHRAFGPFWAHQNAVWNLVANVFDNALYPVMFVDYLRYFPAFRKLVGFQRWLLSLTMLSSVTGLNLLGVDVVASASTIFAALVISPFAALVVYGLPEVNAAALMKPFDRPVHWGTYLSVLLWNTSGYDSVGALAAEVRSPGRDFPRAMVATIVLVTIVYVLPLVVAISLDHHNLAKWTDGHFTVVAQEHVGDWLSAWIALGGALSAVGLLNTLLCTAARVAASSAKLYVVPPCLATLDGKGLPRRATLSIAAVLAFACALPFAELVSISMLFYGATTAFEFCALMTLRYTEPHTPRPFRLPIPRSLLFLVLLPPLLLCALLIFLAHPEAWALFCLSVAVGLGTYYLSHGCSRPARAACWRPQPASSALCPGGEAEGDSEGESRASGSADAKIRPVPTGERQAGTEGHAGDGDAQAAPLPGPRFLFLGSKYGRKGGYGKLRTGEAGPRDGPPEVELAVVGDADRGSKLQERLPPQDETGRAAGAAVPRTSPSQVDVVVVADHVADAPPSAPDSADDAASSGHATPLWGREDPASVRLLSEPQRRGDRASGDTSPVRVVSLPTSLIGRR